MRLGPRVVDHMPGPVRTWTLLHPKDSVIMSGGSNQILSPVAVDVHGVDESGLTQIEVGMPGPLAASRIGRRFKPTFRSDDVVAAVAIDIANADSMTIRLFAHHVLDEFAVLPLVPGGGRGVAQIVRQ